MSSPILASCPSVLSIKLTTFFLFDNIIKAGETSGNLKKSIDYVAENIERNYALYTRVKSALTYPMLVLIVFAIILSLYLIILTKNQ